jgi:hypothetical protein
VYMDGYVKDFIRAFKNNPKKMKQLDVEIILKNDDFFSDTENTEIALKNFHLAVKLWNDLFSICGADKIPAVFNPFEIMKKNRIFERVALIKNGMHPLKCKYCGKNGCVLPWSLRPQVCTNFRCKK